MSCYSHQRRSIDWTRRKWKGDAQIRMSASHMANNVSYTGGLIDMLASLAARALPTILTGLSTDLHSGGISKVISGSVAVGDELFLHNARSCWSSWK